MQSSLKHICERVHVSKARGLQPATLVTINTFTGIFQEFCLIWTNIFNQGRCIRRTTIFIFSFRIGLVTQLNGSALGVLKHNYITKRIREILVGNSRFLIYKSLNQLLYYTISKKIALSYWIWENFGPK